MTFRSTALQRLPRPVANALRAAKVQAKALSGFRRGVECPICHNRLRFLVVNTEGDRAETLCMKCNSLERHRRAVLFLRRCTTLHSDALRVLHVAPEPSLRRELERLPHLDYVTGDLYAEGVDLRLDLTDMDFDDEAFDVILCSHVLEHIPDDRKAMQEMHRVLKPDGWALINVPSDPERTEIYEDESIVEPRDRLQHFGQKDHVRVYSSNGFVERLRQAGFAVEVDPLEFTVRERLRYMLDGDAGWDHSYLCTHARA
jgi:SAM-dependent methyltransferase